MPHWWVTLQRGTPASFIRILQLTTAVHYGVRPKHWFRKSAQGNRSEPLKCLLLPAVSMMGYSSNGNYIVTGYTALIMRNLLTNQNQQLFLSPNNGKVSGGSSQVCNASISPNAGNQVFCLFLDFGYPGISTVTGTTYGIHQYLFEVTPADSITNYIHCPAGEASWDYPKWSNQAQFAAACGSTSEGQDHTVYAVDLKNRSSIRLLAGTEVEQPYLWSGAPIQSTDSICLDSAGQYDFPISLNVAEAATKVLWSGIFMTPLKW